MQKDSRHDTPLLDPVVVGQLGAAFGIKGWLHLVSFTDPASNIFDYPNWHLKQDGQWVPVTLEAHKPHGKGHVVKLEACDVREIAEQLRNTEIAVDRSALPKTNQDAGEFYWSDLTGLTVKTVNGETLGIIDHLFETGANDVIVVKGDKQHMIPYLKTIIKQVDLENGTMIVDWEPIV